MRRRLAFLTVGCLGLLCVPKQAHALGPLDLEFGAKVGGATNPGGNPQNVLGFGLGGRAGVSVLGLYGGVNVVYYFGSSQTMPVDGGGSISNSFTPFSTDWSSVTASSSGPCESDRR
jgi:hypothetical protein